ncbi:hypothetical protein HYV89_00885 [Candidatus Woesearchaeota archaeon]|nr:hypothetical protein [Candidatus Woesearchaeota archaeon]
MKEINLLDFVEGDWYVKLDDKLIKDLINGSINKLGSRKNLSKYLRINDSAISRWLGRDKNRDTMPSYDNVKKLSRLNKIPLREIKKKILGIKSTSESNFLSITKLKLSPELVRSISFIIGDGDLGRTHVRFSNSDKLSVKSVLTDLINSFNLKVKPYFTLTYPRHFNQNEVKDSIKEWELELGYKINRVYEKHITSILGIPFKSKKEFVEVSFFSLTLPLIIKKILPIVKQESLRNKFLGIGYLQGIYSSEGSISYRKENQMRMIQLSMKNNEEVAYVSKLLDFLKIRNSGVKFFEKSNSWYITISGRENIERSFDIDIFGINSGRKLKLEEVIKGYQRYQVSPLNKDVRYLQIIKIIDRDIFDSFEISKKLNMSLIRTQILLKKGFDDGVWDRTWNGSKFLYEKNR